MNLSEFLKLVDSCTEQMTKKELEAFIHSLARKTSKAKREGFIEYLYAAINEDGKENIADEIKEKITCLLKEFEKIENEELCIEGNYNEFYDDWYDDEIDEYVFSNTDEIQSIVNTACDVLESATKIKLYDEAYRLSNEMMMLNVYITGDYSEYEQPFMQLDELYEAGILQFDFCGFGKNALYLQYMTKEGKERVDRIYNTLLYFSSANLKIEQMMQTGNDDLPGFDKFLNDWIEYLGEINNKYSQKLIKEAMQLLDSPEAMLSVAEKYSKVHPCLYEQLMTDGNGFSDEQLLKIGMEALERIPVWLIIRSRVALITAKYALKLGKNDVADDCLMEAFRSDTTPTNYLRIIYNSENFVNLIPFMKEIYNDFFGKLYNNYSDKANEMCSNTVSENEYNSFLLLGREFSRIFKFGEKLTGNNSRGSIVSSKCSLSLLLIYFYAGADMTPGIRAMCTETIKNIEFKIDEYFFLTAEKPEKINPEELLLQCIRKWKQYANWGYDYKEECLKYIDKEIHSGTASILKQQARYSYRTYASYIAAFGEVNDSLGNTDRGKGVLVNQYLKEFPRYSAFRRELQDFI